MKKEFSDTSLILESQERNQNQQISSSLREYQNNTYKGICPINFVSPIIIDKIQNKQTVLEYRHNQIIHTYQRKQLPTELGVAQRFKKLNKELEENDFAYLLDVEDEVYRWVRFIYQNWATYQFQLKEQIATFLNLVSIRLETVKSSDKIYKHLLPFVKEVNKKINHSNSHKRLLPEDKISDILLKHFIQEQETRSKREGIYFVKNENSDMRIALSDYIAQCECLFQDYKWQEIYLKEYHYIQQTQNDQATLIRKRLKQKFDDNVQFERTPSIDCLGCTEFYYMNMNIYDKQVNNCKMALVGSISQITENSSRIKYEICALLNSGGGVCLFNCSRSYLSLIPRGQFITQNGKAQIEQKITSYLKSIYPNPIIGKDVIVTFVPIKEDPFENDHTGQMQRNGDDGYHYYKRRYIKGLYVARIRVSPSNGRTTYVLAQDQSRPLIPIRVKSIFDSQKSKIQIKGRYMTKFTKKRFSEYEYEVNQSYPRDKKYLLTKKFSDFDHQCRKPDSGQFISKKQQILQSAPKISNNEKEYRFASILVCRKERHQEVKFKLRKYNINCQIEMPYQNKFQLRGMNNSAIIYHNVRFNELLQIVSYKKEFQFDGKFTMVILITDYLRLPDRNASRLLSDRDLDSLKQWLMVEHPKQQLYMWQYLNDQNQTQVYLETGSKASSFFIYLILSNNGERAIFKNPKDIDKNKVGKGGTRLNNFIQIYPSPINSLNSTKFQQNIYK